MSRLGPSVWIGSLDGWIASNVQHSAKLQDTKFRFCNSEMEHAAEKSESLACRGSLKELEIKLQATMRSEHQHLQDYHHEAESLQFFVLKSQDMVMVCHGVILSDPLFVFGDDFRGLIIA